MANIKSNKIKQKDNDPNWSTRTLLTNLRCTRELRGWGGKQIHYCYHHSVPHRQRISKYYWFSGKKNIRNILIKFRFQQTVTDILSESKKRYCLFILTEITRQGVEHIFRLSSCPKYRSLTHVILFFFVFSFLFCIVFSMPERQAEHT